MPNADGTVYFRASQGLSSRQSGNYDGIQLPIDPMHSDLDNQVTGLRSHVRRLRNVAEEIRSEAKYQNDLMNQLRMTLIRAQSGIQNNVRRLNRSIVRSGSNHIFHVVVFAVFCLLLVYFWSKFSRR